MPTRSGKERVSEVPQEPPRQKIKFLHQCHIPKELLKEKNIMIFVQETQHGQLNKMQWVTLTQEFTQLHEVNSVQRFGYNTRMDRFLDLRIYGMEMKRIIEFLSTLSKDGEAIVTNHQGEKITFKVTPELVSEALKLPNEGFVLETWLTPKDKSGAFKQTPGHNLTYKDLKHSDTELFLRLHLEMGRIARYTQPNRSLAYATTNIARNPKRATINFSKSLSKDIIKYGSGGRWQRDSFIDSPHVLTRLIYFALGMTDIIPRTQEL